MGRTANHTLPWPELIDPANGPDGYEDLARATEKALLSERSTADDLSYTPTWRSSGPAQPFGMEWTARYNVRNGVCSLNVFGQITAATNGGNGWFLVGLPVRARADIPQQVLNAKFHLQNGFYNFSGRVWTVGGSDEGLPHFPYNTGTSDYSRWASTDSSGRPGTGVPNIPGQFTIQQQGNFSMWGWYFV